MKIVKAAMVVLVALALLGAGPGWAKGKRDVDRELYGMVTDVDVKEKTVTIDKKVFDVSDKTILRDLDGKKIRLKELLPTKVMKGAAVGQHVVFQSVSVPGGMLLMNLQMAKPDF